MALRYVDESNLSNAMKWLVRGSIPIAAILVPAAFFLSVLSPDATVPNGLIYLAYAGAALLAVGALVLGVGLVKRTGTMMLERRVAVAGRLSLESVLAVLAALTQIMALLWTLGSFAAMK